MFAFCQELLIHACRPSTIFAWFLAHWDALVLSLEEVILGYQPALLILFSPRLSLTELFQAGLWTGQSLLSWSPGLWSWPSHPWQFCLICKSYVHQSTSPHLLLDHPCQEVVISALQKPSGLLVRCCVVPPTDVRVQDIQGAWGPGLTNMRLLSVVWRRSGSL